MTRKESPSVKRNMQQKKGSKRHPHLGGVGKEARRHSYRWQKRAMVTFSSAPFLFLLLLSPTLALQYHRCPHHSGCCRDAGLNGRCATTALRSAHLAVSLDAPLFPDVLPPSPPPPFIVRLPWIRNFLASSPGAMLLRRGLPLVAAVLACSVLLGRIRLLLLRSDGGSMVESRRASLRAFVAPLRSSIVHRFRLLAGPVQSCLVKASELNPVVRGERAGDCPLPLTDGWGLCNKVSSVALGGGYVAHRFRYPSEAHRLDLGHGQGVTLCVLTENGRVSKETFYPTTHGEKGGFEIVVRENEGGTSSNNDDDDNVSRFVSFLEALF
mmetsp:Transcript_41697/g.97608  ORF Transcript_41697/g.97608 Transcript_41697/m.97608 type:complete len:325 (-) Transcript_41697:663-1637(-)